MEIINLRGDKDQPVLKVPLYTPMRDVENMIISEVYARQKSIAKTAKILGLGLRTIQRKLGRIRGEREEESGGEK